MHILLKILRQVIQQRNGQNYISKCCCTVFNGMGLEVSCRSCRTNARARSRWWSEQPPNHCRPPQTVWLSTLFACWRYHLRPCLFFFFFNSLSLHSSWCFTLKPSVSRQKQCRCRVSRCSADGYFEPRCVEVCSSVTTFFTSCRAPHKDLWDQELITGRQWEMCMIGYEVGSLLCTCSSRQHQLKLPDSLAARSFKSFCLL